MADRRRSATGVVAVLLVGALLVGCGGDDADTTSGSAADATTPDESNGPEVTSSDEESGADDDAETAAGGDPAGCPTETSLAAVTETTYEGDVEVLAPDTVFPVGHFTLDLDGSGYGPILDGVFSTDASEDVASMTHTATDAPPPGVRRIEVLLEGPAAGETEFPLGVYDVTFADGKVDATPGMGLAHLEIVEGDTGATARNFTELELTHIGDDVICGEFRPVDRSGETSQAPTWLEGSFIADYSEQP